MEGYIKNFLSKYLRNQNVAFIFATISLHFVIIINK